MRTVIQALTVLAWINLGTLSAMAFPNHSELVWIVSAENCSVDTNGLHSNCRFPEIEIREPSEQLPPLPYETVIRVSVSPGCRVEPQSADLQIRLGALSGVTDATSHGVNDFIRYEDLSINYTRRVILTSDNGSPFGSISIYPRVAAIFQSATFEENCQISLEVELNRIALRSRVEAEEHLSALRTQLDSLKRFHRSLSALSACYRQRTETLGFFARVQNAIGLGSENPFCELQEQWQELQSTLEQVTQDRQISGAPSFNVQAFDVQDLNDLTTSFSTLMERSASSYASAQDSNLARIAEGFESFRANGFPMDELLISSIQTEYASQILTQVEQLEAEIEDVERFLHPLLEGDQAYSNFMEDFADILTQEISGPHGVIDQLTHAFQQIGTRTEI